MTTKKNEMMAFVEIEDIFGSLEVVVFPKTYTEYKSLLKEDSIVLIKGRMSIREDEDVSILAGQIKDITDESEFEDSYSSSKKNTYKKEARPSLEATGKKLFIRVNSMKNTDLINSIYRVIMKHQG